MQSNLHAARDLAISIAHEVGEMQVARRSEALSILTKAHANDFVTEVDVESERLIVERISSLHPNDSVLGEEGATIEGTSGYRWVIDPLDGTRSYLTGVGPFSVCIALQRGIETVVGVVHDPVANETYSAIRNCGAELNGQTISVAMKRALSETLVGISINPTQSAKVRISRFFGHCLPVLGDFRRVSAGLNLCYLAAGRVEATVHLDIKEWDVAAGNLIAAEAGSHLISFDEMTAVGCSPSIRDEFIPMARRSLVDE